MRRAKLPEIDHLRDRFAAHGQDHVFRFWDRLDADERAALADQALRLEPQLPVLLAARTASVSAQADPQALQIAPIDAVTLPRTDAEHGRFEEARERGEEMIAAGRVGVFVVAGGQGTRLGFDGPKGNFPVGPVSDRSLFRIQAQKIARLRQRSGKPVPWYVMTSAATDAPTRAAFERAAYFGLDQDDVWIFPQQMVPALDFEGHLLLETPGRIAESPNGHGGSLTALDDSGALDDMERRGIDTLFYYQVDNPLVKMADPVYLGFHEGMDCEMSCKVARKRDPEEKVGVVARIGDKTGIVEYTELTDELRHARGSDSELLYWAGNLAIHVFSLPFLRRVAADADHSLPYHLSAKKIPHVNDEGRPIEVTEPNGHKLERFVFDALGSAAKVCVLEADASREFSPIKNAEGPDSPVTSRRDLTNQYREWLREANVDIPPHCDRIEIDHSKIDGPEDVLSAGIRSIEEANDVIRVASGMDS